VLGGSFSLPSFPFDPFAPRPSRAFPTRDRVQQAASNGDQDLPEAPAEDEVRQKIEQVNGHLAAWKRLET